MGRFGGRKWSGITGLHKEGCSLNVALSARLTSRVSVKTNQTTTARIVNTGGRHHRPQQHQ